MRIVVQRATSAQVSVDGQVVGRLDSPGLVLLVGLTHDDTRTQADHLAAKIWGLRLLEPPDGSNPAAWSRGNLSASDLGAPLLVVSQFTLYADTRKGRRPSWDGAAPAAVAQPLFDYFVDRLRALGAQVATGQFGAEMDVTLTNHGPVTLIIEA
jgi:D-tyrosyl-tRNA(Tyr) deacylase